MHLANETDSEWKLPQLSQTPFEGVYVVEDLLHIGVRRLLAGFGFEYVRQRGLCALNTSGGKRLAHQIRSNQQMWIWYQLPDTRETPQRRLSVREKTDYRPGQLDRPWDRGREVGHVAVPSGRTSRLAKRSGCVVG